MSECWEITAAFGKYFEVLLCSNFLKQMVSGSKLMCPSKMSGESPLSLYYSVICSNCLGNVVIGMEKCGKCGKMCENVEKCAGDPFLIYYCYGLTSPSEFDDYIKMDIQVSPYNIQRDHPNICGHLCLIFLYKCVIKKEPGLNTVLKLNQFFSYKNVRS